MDLRREKLLQRVDGASQAQLILIHAPAGYGKSTFLRQLAEQASTAGGMVGWVSPLPQDTGLARMVQLLASACEKLLHEQKIKPFASSDLPGLLSQFSGPVLLVLDEYDQFAGAETDAFLARLLDHFAAGVRLAIASRVMPDLAAARLKLSGRAVVFGSVDLRFDVGEAHQFFVDRPGVGSEEVRRLHSRLDGWPAAFQFISLALQSSESSAGDALSRALAGDMVEYMAKEVFELQPPDVQKLLLDACLPDRISAQLLNHIAVGEEGESSLEALWGAGLFLDPVGGDRVWYRFHPLFGDFLRQRARHFMTKDDLEQRHQRIAGWFAGHSMLEAAIEHYLAAGDHEKAADLLEAVSTKLVKEERLELLLALAERLEPDLFLARPVLVSHAIIAYGFRRNFSRAHQLLDWMQHYDQDSPPEVLAEREVHRCYILAAEDHVEEMGARARDAIKWLGQDRPFSAGVALNAYAFWLAAQSQFTEAADLMLKARSLHEDAENYFGGCYAEAILGSIKMSQGNAEEAFASLARSLERVEQSAPAGTWAGAVIAAHLGDAAYETDRLAEAKTSIEKYLPFIQQQCIVDPLCLGTVALARIAESQGDIVRAHELYESLITSGHKYGLERLVACGRAELVREATLAGDIETAERRMRALGPEAHISTDGQLIFASGEIEAQRITYLRLLVHSGRCSEARAGLQGEIRTAGVRRRVRRLARLKTLLAICLEQEGNHALARRTLIEAVTHAATGGMKRVILDEGVIAIRLLNELSAENLAHNVAWGDDPVADWVRRLVEDNGVASAEVEAPLEQPVETLTPREQDLLRFLALGHSNTDLSDRLAVSENTIKFHLRNIYTKLGVSNRTQAVQAARHFRLIEP